MNKNVTFQKSTTILLRNSLLFMRAFVLFCVLSPSLSRAATYYVDPNGSDSNAGSGSLPWKTIQHAANTTTAGDTVRVKTGSYPERVATQTPGAAETYITFKAEGEVVMYGFKIYHDYVQIEGFKVTQADAVVRASDFSSITSDTAGLFSDLNAKGYIDSNGVIEDAFRSIIASTDPLPGMNLAAPYASDNDAIYEVLNTVADAARSGGIFIKGNHAEIIGNHFFNIKGAAAISGSAQGSVSFVHVADNFVEASQYGIVIYGNDWLVESNEVTRLIEYFPYQRYSDADYCRFFGNNHVLRRNYFHGTRLEEVCGDLNDLNSCAHVDGFQTYSSANGNYSSKNILIEGNMVLDYSNGMMVENNSEMSSNLTIRSNVFARSIRPNVGFALNIQDTPYVSVLNNTFAYNISGGGVAIINDNSTGAKYAVLKNNIISGYGNYPGYSFRGNNTLDDSAVADYNLVISTDGTANVFHSGLHDNDLLAEDPLFSDIMDIVGHDGIAFTEDDGLNLQAASPAIGAGENGVDLGAYPYSPPTDQRIPSPPRNLRAL